MDEKYKCTCLLRMQPCGREALYRYKVLDDGDWYYLCFEHWGETAVARVIDKESVYTKTCERIPAGQDNTNYHVLRRIRESRE